MLSIKLKKEGVKLGIGNATRGMVSKRNSAKKRRENMNRKCNERDGNTMMDILYNLPFLKIKI